MLAHVMMQKTLFPMTAPQAVIDEVIADVGPNPIVIPMRETPYRTHRNSNEPAWIKAAEWLVNRGENVVFIPDSSVPDKVYAGFKTYKKAAESVLHRMALANLAKLTLGANSGNMVFSFYSQKPTLFFNPVVDESNEASDKYWLNNGVPRDSQPPWFTNLQKIVWWGTDTAENIIETLGMWFSMEIGMNVWPMALAPRFPVFGVVSNKDRGLNIKAAMETGHPVLKSKGKFNERRISLVCYGPSLKKNWRKIKHPIMTVSGAHDFLISKGIIPDYHVECDPREYKTKFIENPHKDVHYLIATCIHPKAWELLKGQNVTMWHLHNGPGSEESIREHDPVGELIGGGTTVGMRALEVAARLGFKKFDIYGMDSSCDTDGRHAGEHPGKHQNQFKVRCGTNPKEFVTTPQMKEAAEEFMRFISPRLVMVDGKQMWEQNDIDVRVHGDGLLQAMIHESKLMMEAA
jgi:uncharacterized Rossmann fold enzyme